MTATTERSEQPATRVSGPRPVVAILGLVGLTLATRLPGLDRPRAFVFDEIYYALDAAELLRHGVEPAAAHPPLGKWLIAAGIQVAGFTPTGWRLAALLAGIALVLVTWWAARTVTDDPWLALLGAGLVALDGIAYVTGRLALLDVFVALATTVAAGATLAALRDRADAERLRRWRWVAALALGAGVAVKWGAVWTWPVVAAVLVSLERRVAAPGGPRRRRTVAVLATLTLVPAGVYLVAYGPWLAGAERSRAGLEHCGGEQPCRLGALDRVEVWVDHQLELLEFHAELEVDNPEAAPAWSWAAQWAPSDLYRKPCRADHAPAPRDLDDGVCPADGGSTRARLLALANPVGWAAGLVALVVGAVLAVARRDDRAGVVLALAASQWLPWMLSGRAVYSYYAVSLVPFLALAVVVALDRLPRRRRGPVVAGVAALTVLAFLWLVPLWNGTALDDGAAGLRLWLSGWS